MSKHPVFCSILKRISDGHQYPDDPYAALADSKVIVEKARKETHQELLRNSVTVSVRILARWFVSRARDLVDVAFCESLCRPSSVNLTVKQCF